MNMDRNCLLQKKIITKLNMINPHFTRKVKCGDLSAVQYIERITKCTKFLNSDATLKERIYCIVHGITTMPFCHHCGAPTKLQYHHDTKNYRFTKFCSPKHAALYRNEDDIQTTRNNTNMDLFGVPNPMLLQKFRDKQASKMHERYIYGHPKRSHWSEETNNVINSPAALHYLHHVCNISINAISGMLCVDGTVISKKMNLYGIKLLHYTRSLGEIQVCEFLSSLDIEFITNDRIIISKELDIYIPSHKIAIEYNGLYWHSDFNNHINKHTHADKHAACASQGVQLLTIFEDEWIEKQDIVKNKLKSLLGLSTDRSIGARKTSVDIVTPDEKREFYNTHHIQGSGPGSITIGLRHEGVLVACMSFIQQKNKHYLNRYATSCGVPGGFTKLLAHFADNYDWNEVVSFADLRWSNGNLYEMNGWTLDKIIPPDYCYVDTNTNQRIHKFNYRRKHLHRRLKVFDPSLSERENCDINKIPRLWDCGKMRFSIKNINTHDNQVMKMGLD